ncbi:MAG: MarR family winged helix-turn-helix transcriptional regulator [Solirubrobacterales bacterium]
MSRQSRREQVVGELMYEMRAHGTANEKFDDAAHEALDLNRTDVRCLDIVEREGGRLTAGALAELSGLTTAAITGILDRLEAKGYARRVRDVSDRRRVFVELTPLAGERTGRIWGPLARKAEGILAKLSVEDLELMRDWFRAGRELNEREIERVKKLSFE